MRPEKHASENRTGSYVPDYGEVETAFHEFASWLETTSPGEYPEAPEFKDWEQALYAFQIWYSREVRKWQAEALREAANHLRDQDIPAIAGKDTDGERTIFATTPYRWLLDRADRIEKETDQ